MAEPPPPGSADRLFALLDRIDRTRALLARSAWLMETAARALEDAERARGGVRPPSSASVRRCADASDRSAERPDRPDRPPTEPPADPR